MTSAHRPRPTRAITGRPHHRLRPHGHPDVLAAIDGHDVAIGGDRSWHPHGRRVRVPDADLGSLGVHAVTLGSGPHLVLLHGFVQASWCWRDVLDDLARHHTVHAVCLPGFGWSEKPTAAPMRLPDQARRLLTWLDVMGIGRADVVGCSMGGALALMLAARAPARLGRVVLVNPAGPGAYPMAWLAALQRRAWAPLLRLPGVPFGLRMGLRFTAYAQLPVDDAYMAHFLAPLRTPGAAESALAVASTYNADLRQLEAELAAVQAPALVIRGGKDRIIPGRVVQGIASALSDSRIVIYADAGHCPMEEEPTRFARDVLAFLGPGRHPATIAPDERA